MNAERIVNQLKQEFPGKNILQLPPDNPNEIICELESTPEFSVAIAYIDQSVPHYHTKTREKYIIEQGRLILNEAGRETELREGDEYTVYPPIIHSARGKSTRVRVESKPGWIPEDHILDLSHSPST
ncbi:MAG: hypothetical protein A2152_03785 [Candidatus Levybacteria bacterium RBG_16_35_6]|nr:MAG: hypothetical protein A2152_03785 [Candidatus Levybacteria bacterium RBG_16_35_6]